jgi:hypothetical protein
MSSDPASILLGTHSPACEGRAIDAYSALKPIDALRVFSSTSLTLPYVGGFRPFSRKGIPATGK